MGSSHSQPAAPPATTQPTSSRSPPTSRPPLRPASSIASSSRFASLRRLSALTRRDSQKRSRAGSSSTADAEQKKRKVDSATAGESSSGPSPLSSSLPLFSPNDSDQSNTSEGTGTPFASLVSPTSPGPPVLPTSSTARPTAPSYIPIPAAPYPQPGSPPLSPDPLLPDRLRTLSAIHDTLGPDWTSSTSNPATAQERLQDLRRRSLRADASSRRLNSVLDSTSSTTNSSHLSASTAASASDPDPQVEDLRAQLERARTDLEATRREHEQLSRRERDQLMPEMLGPRRGPPRLTRSWSTEAASGDADPNGGTGLGGGNAGTTRIPAGAVLVIQGLAQTHAAQDNSGESRARSGRGSMLRRHSSSESPTAHGGQGEASSGASGSSGGSTRDGNAVSEESLEAQARMISGLLTVAAAATATTLLSPNTPPPTGGRPSIANPISAFLDRFRPHRRTAPTVEAALGEYLRNALRDRRRMDQNGSISGVANPTSSAADTTTISDDFQRFLEGMQSDLVGAVRQFAALPGQPATPPPAEAAPGSPTAELPSPVPAVEAPNEVEIGPSEQSESTAQEPAASSDINGSPNEPVIDIPSFHYQLGQTRRDDASRRYGVSGGQDGQPRVLNFFRAHLFPPVREGEPTTETSADDPNGMVPCIFIGVRSLAHDPTMTTDDLVQHPNFPFVDGNVPERNNAPDPLQEPETPPEPTASGPSTPLTRSTSDRPSTPMPGFPPAIDRPSLRERVMNRLNPRRNVARPPGPLNTYLVFVIGGYYPRSHPVLSIPNLVTGGPLTDEEMALVSELMGPGKPPTASKDEIENSGLTVVLASEIPKLGEQGKVLDNCVERCLVCLGDYEPEEECRVLKCRHAFHKDCVDHWLSEGRNSCPACRSEAVNVKKGPAQAAHASDEPAGEGASEPERTSADPVIGLSRIPQASSADDLDRIFDELD